MNKQLRGAEMIAGTYIFDVRVSSQALALNKFLWRMKDAEHRRNFLEAADALMIASGLSEQERDLVRTRDWLGLIKKGANFFALEKFARACQTSNLAVYAQMRGESLEKFLKTRRVPGAQ